MRDFSNSHHMLALNTATLGHNLEGHGAGWSSEQVIDACAQRGYGAISFWRREVAGQNAYLLGNKVRAAGMQVCGLCRSPYLTGPYALPSEQQIIDDFKSAIDMAHELGTEVLTIVTGGVIKHSHSITKSLDKVTELLTAVLPHAQQAKVKLALEPLNPVYGGDRSCLVTIRDAIDICNKLAHPNIAIALDVYHIWWDTDIANELKRVASEQIAGYHLCDWLADTQDTLLDRGMMGDGVADLKAIRGAVESAGYAGYCEVEVFSANNWWKRDPKEVLDVIIDRFRTVC